MSPPRPRRADAPAPDLGGPWESAAAARRHRDTATLENRTPVRREITLRDFWEAWEGPSAAHEESLRHEIIIYLRRLLALLIIALISDCTCSFVFLRCNFFHESSRVHTQKSVF